MTTKRTFRKEITLKITKKNSNISKYFSWKKKKIIFNFTKYPNHNKIKKSNKQKFYSKKKYPKNKLKKKLNKLHKLQRPVEGKGRKNILIIFLKLTIITHLIEENLQAKIMQT